MDAVAEALARAAAEQSMPQALPVPAVVPGRTLLADGDYLAYYCGGNENTSPGEARDAARERLERMRILSGCEKIVVHLTDDSSTKGMRYAIATINGYQFKRTGHKPKNWAYLREWMQSGGGGMFKVKTWGDREADDGAAYHAMVLGPQLAVLTCADKDWRMIPGWHIDWKTWLLTFVAPKTFRIDALDGHIHGEYFFWLQCLMGDGVDCIPGLPKYCVSGKPKLMGEKTAEKFMQMNDVQDNDKAFSVVGALYRTYYGDGWPDALAEQMALLWMRRDATAEIDDCLRYLGPFVERTMQPAFNRLMARVTQMKQEAEALCKS